MSASVYVASSWRNEKQPAVVARMRAEGFNVYDFRNPEPGNYGFRWSSIDPEWQSWTTEEYRDALQHRIAQHAFSCDLQAMEQSDACIIVLPCGRSAHLEAGWFTGKGRPVLFLVEGPAVEPELMYLLGTGIGLTLDECVSMLRAIGDATVDHAQEPARLLLASGELANLCSDCHSIVTRISILEKD